MIDDNKKSPLEIKSDKPGKINKKQKGKPISSIPRELGPKKTDFTNHKESQVKKGKKRISKSSQKTHPNYSNNTKNKNIKNNKNYKTFIPETKSNKNFSHTARKNIKGFPNENNDIIKNNKNSNNHKKSIKSQSNFGIRINRDTIGNKMIREEIAREKKMYTEKIKIIKAHILSLQKKEEELEKKVMILNSRENALGNLNIEKEDN